jgi:predicted nuclease of predicted toxin-antitoxin system
MTDLAIFQKAATEHRILLTFDLDFGEIAALSGIEPVTVILFRLANTRTENVRSRLEAVLREVRDSLAEAAVITVEETRHRVRRLPIGTG